VTFGTSSDPVIVKIDRSKFFWKLFQRVPLFFITALVEKLTDQNELGSLTESTILFVKDPNYWKEEDTL
jgi:hypothetical protein